MICRSMAEVRSGEVAARATSLYRCLQTACCRTGSEATGSAATVEHNGVAEKYLQRHGYLHRYVCEFVLSHAMHETLRAHSTQGPYGHACANIYTCFTAPNTFFRTNAENVHRLIVDYANL